VNETEVHPALAKFGGPRDVAVFDGG